MDNDFDLLGQFADDPEVADLTKRLLKATLEQALRNLEMGNQSARDQVTRSLLPVVAKGLSREADRGDVMAELREEVDALHKEINRGHEDD